MAPKNKKQKGDKRTITMKKYEFNEHEVEPEEDEHDEEEDEEAGGSAAKTKTQKKETTQKDDNELRIEDVMRWGGTQADYVMLAHLNEDNENELVDGGKKVAIDDLEDGELEKFIAKIGIRSYAEVQIIPDEPEEPEGGDSQDTAQTEGQSSKDANQKESKKAKAKKDPEASKDGAQEANDKKTKKNARKNAKQSASVFEFQPRQFLLVKPGGKWYDFEYSSESTDSSAPPQDASVVKQYKDLAQQLFEAEAQLYKTRKSMQKGANTAWMKSVVSTGTLPDRMAAMTVLIQDAPVHTLEHVESLVGMVTKKASRRMGMMALDTLQELLLSDLLPENRKLRPFAQRPFDRVEEMASGNRDTRDRRLVLWYFEDRLKRHMAEFVTALDGVARDTVAANKAKALATAHRLLCSRPEQERALLIQVVNKVGDPETQNAAKASYLLETLLHEHPNMKGVVCSEVERLVFRPNISPKAQYYAICFLNQVLLSHEEAELATKLISMYFSFFRACVKNKDVNSKMLGALLTGVNRAYPYTKAGDDKVKEQLDTLFKVVHMVRFNTAVQALMLLFQAMDAQQTISDRYYVALYRKLLDPGLCVSSRQSMFLNLLYKSMKADIVLRRVKAFVKRLLQVSQEQNATFACGALFLVSEVMRNKPGLRLLLQDNNTDVEEEVFKDAADDDDDEERFVDADKVEEGQSVERTAKGPRPAASWVHHQNLEGKKLETYDPHHRNPLYCGADRSTLWELHRLSAHYHPSVSLFAKTIIQGELIQYSGDPLQDFTLIRFLDRFVFRNPKQAKGKQNTDTTVMQPKQKMFGLNNVRSMAVNCEAFLSKDESQIPVDEIFFHRFFKKQEKEKEKQKRRPKRQEDEESVEDVDDDEFERILDAAEGDDLFIDLQVDDLDFAGDVKSSKGKKKQGSEADSDDSDVDMDEDLDDEEVSLGSMDEEDFGDELEEEGGTFMGPEGNDDDDDDDDDEIPELDEDDGGFDESDVEEELELPSRSKKTKRKITEDLDISGSIGSKLEKKKKLKKAKKDDVTMFASAEEFGSMLDENAGSTFDSTGMNAMANTDKAGVKQLKWEAQRDDWVHGRDAKTLRRKKSSFKKRKMAGLTAMFGQAKAKGRTFKKKK